MTHQRVFISYSHDSHGHQERVLDLANRLRRSGVNAVVDQYAPAPPMGWPLWMDLEIQNADFVLLVCTETYRRRVELKDAPGRGRGVMWEAKIIYNLLYDADAAVQKFIPILLEHGELSSIPVPLRGVAYYDVSTARGYEDLYRHLTNQPRHSMPELGLVEPMPEIEERSYPSSLGLRPLDDADADRDRSNRLKVIDNVHRDWVDGVLNQSLYEVARIEVKLESNKKAVEQALNAIVQAPDRPPVAVPPGTPISEIFDDEGRALLILGAPGTGKTTLLLELARDLLGRARQEDNHPIPVVFNLSTWAVRRQSLANWLVAELRERNSVPTRLARRWVNAELILPLLDGLDEVDGDHRSACVEAINDFRRDHGLLPIVVCSRTADYEAVGRQVRLRTAILVQPLTESQIQRYLEQVGAPLYSLRVAFEQDPHLRELLDTPLMLWVATLAYRQASVDLSVGDTLEKRRSHLFASFVNAMFERRAPEARFGREQTVQWLSWFASTMNRNNQTVFYFESLDLSWLATGAQKWVWGAGVVLATATFSGLIYGLLYLLRHGETSGPVFGRSTPLLLGVTLWLVFFLLEFRPVETLRVSLRDLSSRTYGATKASIIVGLIYCPIYGWSFGLPFALLAGLTTLVTASVAVETRKTPNQGTLRSTRLALAAALTGGLTVWLICWLIGVDAGDGKSIRYAVGAGLFFGLGYGGLFSLRHYSLRLALWITHVVPLNWVRFLERANERLFLQKVGAGYIFTHRMLRDHFAAAHPDHK